MLVGEECAPWAQGELPQATGSALQLLQVVDLTDNMLSLTTGRPFLIRLLADFDLTVPLGIATRFTVQASLNGHSLGALNGTESDCLNVTLDTDSLAYTHNVRVPALDEAGPLELHAELELLSPTGELLQTLRYPEVGTITREVFDPPEFRITFVRSPSRTWFPTSWRGMRRTCLPP